MKKRKLPEYDILGAVCALKEGTPAHVAIKKFHLTKAQADDLHEHLAALDRLAHDRWPELTPYERYSVFGDSFGFTRRRPLRIVIQQHDQSVTVCSALRC